jgi:hypothetical protein
MEHRQSQSPEPILEATDTTVPPTVLTGPTALTDEPQHDDISPPGEVIGGEDHELQHELEHLEPVRTYVPVITPVPTRSRTQPPPQREPSTRIRRAPERYNLATTDDLTTIENYLQTHMSVSRGLRMFKEKTSLAIEGEVKSLLAKKTFSGVDVSAWAVDKKKILRSVMNTVEKYHPTLDEKGDRSVDKVKALLCVDGRAQERPVPTC